MFRIKKSITLIVLYAAVFSSISAFAQKKDKKTLLLKREAERHALHLRDSMMRSFNKSDTSINSLLQRIEQYTTLFNQIKNNLSGGLDTVEAGQQLPPIAKRLDKISNVGNTHKSSTLRYLFVLRDNLDRIQSTLYDLQSDLEDVNEKLAQNQNDLIKFSKDTILKIIPNDSLIRKTFFTQLKQVKLTWHKIDSANRKALLKVNLLQDKLAVAYTKTLDESDQVDSKIKGFAVKAFAGECDYIWLPDPQYNDFSAAFDSTIKLNNLLFNYFLKSETPTHLAGLLFLVLVFSWIIYSRTKALNGSETPKKIFDEANFISKRPIICSILIVTAITPYFYVHPPTVFIETFFIISISLSLVLVKKVVPSSAYKFLLQLFLLTIGYAVSNLFFEISNIDRYIIFLFSILSVIIAYRFYKIFKNNPDGQLPYTGPALKIFIGLQIISLVLNITGRFSLAKIIGVTAVFNFWLLVVLFLVIKIIIQGLYLQFQIKRDADSIINWIDYNLVKKKFTNTLVIAASLLWLFFLLQNLNIDDWASDYADAIFDLSHSVAGATFTFGGFVIFIAVIWLSSIASKLISYLYDISGRQIGDLSALKNKNRTSALIIRIGVFSVGFLLAVAASNFPLDKLTIIISAFGVGIGFGLQNIVNNLVSGLILAFEKPIQIGDVIQVDGHTGTMKEIGIRSSKVVTGDGSEVIIPNGDLISHQVINWTLSNSNRQIELKIITAYGVDITRVKEILKNLLANRQDIMASPAPAVFLNNISETAVEFRVLFWVADISTTSEFRSRLLGEIYQAIVKEGIPLPNTRNDVYVHFPEGVPAVNSVEIPADKKDKTIGEKQTKKIPPDPAQ